MWLHELAADGHENLWYGLAATERSTGNRGFRAEFLTGGRYSSAPGLTQPQGGSADAERMASRWLNASFPSPRN
jgi:hypothetical protein